MDISFGKGTYIKMYQYCRAHNVCFGRSCVAELSSFVPSRLRLSSSVVFACRAPHAYSLHSHHLYSWSRPCPRLCPLHFIAGATGRHSQHHSQFLWARSWKPLCVHPRPHPPPHAGQHVQCVHHCIPSLFPGRWLHC